MEAMGIVNASEVPAQHLLEDRALCLQLGSRPTQERECTLKARDIGMEACSPLARMAWKFPRHFVHSDTCVMGYWKELPPQENFIQDLLSLNFGGLSSADL